MSSFICECCGKRKNGSLYTEKFENRSFFTCQECHEKIKNLQSTDTNLQNEAIAYLASYADSQTVAGQFINKTLGITEKQVQEPAVRTVTETSLVIAGFMFFMFSLILYLNSISNEYGVANIQATVFSATSFVVATICVIGARIIKTLRNVLKK